MFFDVVLFALCTVRKPVRMCQGWEGGEVKLWDLDDGRCLKTLKGLHTEKVTAAKFLPKCALG